MTEPFATLNGHLVTGATVRVPYGGIWQADVDLATDDDIAGAATLRIAGQDFVGTLLPTASGVYGLTSKRRLVGGAGGWGKELKPRHYHNDAGVKRSLVAGDAAREVGETLELLAGVDGSLGIDFTRAAQPAARLLDLVFGGAMPWWVDFDGVTRAGARAQKDAGADVELLDFDPRDRVATLGMDLVASVGIGTVLRDSRLPAQLVVRELELVVADGAFRASAWCRDLATPRKSRLLRAIQAIVRATFPNYAFLASYRYRVVKMTGDRVDLQAIKKAPGLPDVLPISMWPGMAGLSAELEPGSTVLVQFIEGDPAQPMITHYQPKGAPGFLPVSVALDASETVRIGATAESVELGKEVEELDASACLGRYVRFGDIVTVGTQTSPIAKATDFNVSTAGTP